MQLLASLNEFRDPVLGLSDPHEGRQSHTPLARSTKPCPGQLESKKGKFYITLSKLFTLFLPWQTCLFRHQLGFSEKHSSQVAITCNDYLLTFPPLSIARYSFIQLSQQGRQWRERKYPNFETVTKGHSNPGSIDCESGFLPLNYRAP